MSEQYPGRRRSVLSAVVATWIRIQGIYIILVGTGMSKNDVNETMSSAVLKEGAGYTTVYDVGGFIGGEAQIEYMKSLMPKKVAETAEMGDVLELAT